jgi:hypothetical protein
MAWSLQSLPGTQSDHTSFIGGKPRLPIGMEIPVCQLCRSPQTFFFQVAMPEGTLWPGSSLGVYQCTRCADGGHLIPEMLTTALPGADIPQGFLKEYQRNFSLLVFPTDQCEIATHYEESIVFSEIQLAEGDTLGSLGKLSGDPKWLLENESPATYGGSTGMAFLLQIAPSFEFNLTTDAEPQIELNLMGELEPSPLDYYQLFIGNTLYLFGTRTGEQVVYAITQV